MSYAYETAQLDLEIYRLMTISVSGEGLSEATKGKPDGDFTDRAVITWLRRWERVEVSRIVLSIAVILRNAIQASPREHDWTDEKGLDRIVGSLFTEKDPRVTKSPSGEGIILKPGGNLTFRNALDKVIHAKRVMFQSELDDHENPEGINPHSLRRGDILPPQSLTLFGDWNGKDPWEADVWLWDYALAATNLVP